MKEFDNIIGYESVKNELYQIIDIFKNQETYKKMGAKLPRGVLLYGNPGMGKTMLAQALIEACGVKSFLLKKKKDNRDSLQEISDTFDAAAKEKAAIILIDDIDKFCEVDDIDVDDEAFVAMQTGIDSLKNKNVLVVATANNYRRLPDSLRRNGRFDRKIGLKSPTNEDARKIIEFYMKTKKVNENINYEDVAKMISYTSCADLETILNESAIYAAYQRKDSIDIDDVVKAFLRNEYNVSDDDLQCNKEDIEAVALHEAGHVAMAEILKEGSVGFVCIQPSSKGKTEGFTHLCNELKRRPENVLIALGGKVAVELFYEGRCASGCQSDLERAATMLRDGISESGTCGIGMLDVANHRFPNTSESLNARNEAVTQAELERHLFLAKTILLNNKEFVKKLSEKLRTKRTLLFSEIREIRKTVTVTETEIN